MHPKEQRKTGQGGIFKSRLDQIVDMKHSLAVRGSKIDWGFLERCFGAVYIDRPGRPPLPTRLMAGLAILKSMHNLYDEVVCNRCVENPYFQLFCGEEFLEHRLPFDGSSITRSRQRMGEEKLAALVQESLAVATRTGAAKPSDFSRVIVDTTVQPKNAMFPSDARLTQRARERLVRLAKDKGVKLRQSYERVGKLALIKQQRYAHAKQFNRSNRALRTLRTQLGRVIRDIRRKIAGDEGLEKVFYGPLSQACGVLTQRARQRGPKIHSLRAPEVECIGQGKAHKPYEFGVKVSVATPIDRCKGGQFVAHVKPLPGLPYDGHTLARVLPALESQIGVSLKRIVADAGYKGHNALERHKLKVYPSGQKPHVNGQVKRDLKRRAAVEPVIGHLKSEHRMGRSYLAGRAGDANNAVLAAVGYNFSLLIKWLRLVLFKTGSRSAPHSTSAGT